MKNLSKNIISSACALAIVVGSAVAQTPVDLINDDFSSGSFTTGTKFTFNEIDGGWHKRSSNGPAWSIDGITENLKNPQLVNNDDKPAFLLKSLSETDASLTQITVSFDYSVAANSTLYFHAALMTGASNGTLNAGVSNSNGTYAGDQYVTGFVGGALNLKDGTTPGASDANAIATIVGSAGPTTGTFTQSYIISGYTGISDITDVTHILAVFAADNAVPGGAIEIDNLIITAEVAPVVPTITWDGETDANWATATNWVDDVAPVSLDELIFTGTANTATNNDFAAGTEFAGISLTNTADTESFSLGGNSIILGGNITQSSAASGSISDTISLDMELNGDRTVNSGTDHNLEISGIISEDGSARGLNKSGAGTLTLSAANTYTGVTSITGGILTVTDSAALGTVAGNTTVVDNSALRIEGGITLAEPLNIAGDGDEQNTGAIQNSGLNTLTGAITLDGQVRLETEGANTGTDTLTFTGGVTGDGRTSLIGDYVFNTLPFVISDELRVGGDGTAGVITTKKTVFNVAGNDWTKAVLFFGGSIELGVADALPVGSDVEFGWAAWNQSISSLDLNGFNQTVKSIKQSSNSVGVGGDVNITNSSGSNVLTVDTDGPLNDSAADAEYQGRITGGISLVKDGDGTLILNNLSAATDGGAVIPNSYTGTTTINDGILQIGNGGTTGALPITSAITINGNGTLLFNRSDALTQGTDFSSAAITGAGKIVKLGADTLTLTIDNTYTNRTSLGANTDGIVGGTLVIESAAALGTSDLFFENDASFELGVSGMTVANNLDVFNRAGTLRTVRLDLPGTATGTLTGEVEIRFTKANGFAVDVGTDDTLTMSGQIFNANGGGAGLDKVGDGTLIISNTANSYEGNTTVVAGTLSLGDGTSDTQLNDAEDLIVETGATLNLNFTSTDTVKSLVLGGVTMPAGTYNAANSPTFITGAGSIEVPPDTYSDWAADNSVTGGIDGDSDGDGNLNIIEYALDILIDGYEAPGTLTGNTISFPKRAEAVTNGDVLYSIEVSTDLGVDDPWTPVTPTTDDASAITYTFTPGSPDEEFARLSVETAP